MPAHLLQLDQALVEVAAGRCARLLVAMPPRHGKSEEVSRYFPAWYLGHFPDRRVILASYEASFAESWGRGAREVLAAWGPTVFGVTVSETSASASWWGITGHSGYMATAGVGGPITGKGGNVIIVDDPIKNAEEARSPLMRARAWDWYRSVLRTRLEPGGAIIVVMTRWHADDLAGRLREAAARGGEAWTEIRLPAIAEADDPLGRPIGAALWPERFSQAVLQATEESVGAYWWAAQYQQRPTVEGGEIFLRTGLRTYTVEDDTYVLQLRNSEDEVTGTVRVADHGAARFGTVDLAISEKESADYTVLLSCASLPEGRLAILNCFRAHVGPGEHVTQFLRLRDQWQLDWIGIEDTQFQRDVVAQAHRRGLAARPLIARGDKVVRAQGAAALWNAGRIFLPAHAPWLERFVEELATFPRGRHDDQVDALAYAVRALQRPAPMLVAPIGLPRVSPWRWR